MILNYSYEYLHHTHSVLALYPLHTHSVHALYPLRTHSIPTLYPLRTRSVHAPYRATRATGPIPPFLHYSHGKDSYQVILSKTWSSQSFLTVNKCSLIMFWSCNRNPHNVPSLVHSLFVNISFSLVVLIWIAGVTVIATRSPDIIWTNITY